MTTEAQPLHRQHAIGFIKHKGMDDYVFAIPAESALDGQKFVQRVRVELSRMRKYVRDQGMAVKPFRMKLVSITFADKDYIDPVLAGKCTITLRKDAPDAQIARDVADAMSDLTNGGAII